MQGDTGSGDEHDRGPRDLAKMIRCENRELGSDFGARMDYTESKHIDMEETMNTVEAKIRTVVAHVHSVAREAAVAGGDAWAVVTPASKARDRAKREIEPTNVKDERERWRYRRKNTQLWSSADFVETERNRTLSTPCTSCCKGPAWR